MFKKILNLKGSSWLFMAMCLVVLGHLANAKWDDFIIIAIFSASFFIVDAIEKNKVDE